jgi:signal-transduction protein with cAMP-binding, CBS, and nucleotidyltransferase domain
MTIDRLTLRDVVKTFELPTIEPDASITDAIGTMVDSNCYTLLVPRKSRSDAHGILTKRDVIAKVIADGKDPDKVKVSDCMSRPLVLLTNLSLDLRWVAKAMLNSRVATIAVFEKGDFYGYVTESCIMDGLFHAMRRARLEEGVEFVSC